MSSIWGNNIKLSIFGESHGKAIGVTIHNLPSGIKLDGERIFAFMKRRSPGRDEMSTPRKEEDTPEILSGVYKGYTTGAPLTALISNNDIKSKDYDKLSFLPRPSHADYAAEIRYNGYNDKRGGGHFSGRLTAPLVFAGAIASQILEAKNIYIGAQIKSIFDVQGESFDSDNITKSQLDKLKGADFPALSKGKEMQEAIQMAKQNMDSVGGIIECCIINLKAGLGNPIFDGIENSISSIIFGIPAVKGIEFGGGFELTKKEGSRTNDGIYCENDEIKTYTNNNGGITGGISNGMPIIFRVAIKPTPSIGVEQNTINTATLKNEKIKIMGRHDPCIVKRAVPCIEAAANIAILDLIMGAKWI